MAQAGLLGDRRFLPYFVTQSIAAFNDNVFKNAVVVLIVFTADRPDVLVNLCSGAFVLPFFLASATGGQLAERLPKAWLIRRLKAAEIGIMAVGAVALATHALGAAVAALFLAGIQSALFGPAKFSLLPQALRPAELVPANALVELATFLAILLGTIAGGLLVAGPSGPHVAGAAIVLVATLGYLSSRAIPELPAVRPDLVVDRNPVPEMLRLMRLRGAGRSVTVSVFAISWFWFLGAAYLTQVPAYAHRVLGGDEHVVTALLAAFSVGIGLGSMLCARLSHDELRPRLVPLGALGLSLFGGHLAYLALEAGTVAPRGLGAFVADPGGWLVLADLVMIGGFGGLYVVPLQALVQLRAPPGFGSRTIASVNLWNSVFLVASALFCGILLGPVQLGIPALFALLAALNLLGTGLLFGLEPEFLRGPRGRASPVG